MGTSITKGHGIGDKGPLDGNGTSNWQTVTSFVTKAVGFVCTAAVFSFCVAALRERSADKRREACRKQCRAATKKRKKRKKG